MFEPRRCWAIVDEDDSRAAVSETDRDGAESPRVGKYEALGAELGRLTDSKSEAYGDSFGRCGEILRILYPNGITPNQYTDALGVVRVVDKLFRIANRKDAFGESPWRDIAGYGIRGASED